MSEIRNIRLLSIVEKGFSLSPEKIPTTKEECENDIKPGFGLHLMVDIEKSTLTADAKVFYGYPNKQDGIVASLDFSYVLYVERLNEFIKEVDGEKKMAMPEGFMTDVISDVYATARTLISIRLASTPLKDLYLPFNGAKHIVKNMEN